MQPAKSHLSVVSGTSVAAHLRGLRRRLGHAAVLGGVAQVERVAYSDEAMSILIRLDAKTRKEAMAAIARLSDKARTNLPPSANRKPSPNERTKINWTDELVARFKREAPRSKDDFDLCRRLGFPSYCRGAMRAARARHGFRRAVATTRAVQEAVSVARLPLAA